MQTYDKTLAAHFGEILERREAELRGILRASDELVEQAQSTPAHEVLDFKDIASEESQANVDEVKADHAAHEFEQVLAARRSLQDGGYGACLDCEEPIDLRRLNALPATPYCAACQAIRERAYATAARR